MVSVIGKAPFSDHWNKINPINDVVGRKAFENLACISRKQLESGCEVSHAWWCGECGVKGWEGTCGLDRQDHTKGVVDRVGVGVRKPLLGIGRGTSTVDGLVGV